MTTRTETISADSVFKPALLLMCGRTLAFIATFFIPVVLARIFSPALFGTYKQLFLIHSTAYFLAQAGMASSLYYFLPHAGKNGGRYVANSFVFLSGVGFLGFAALVLGAPHIAKWMNNPALVGYLFWTGLYLGLMMMSASLEMVLIARGEFLWASISYATSDLARAAALLLPVIIFRRLDSLLIGAVVVAAFRVIATLLYFRGAFRKDFRPDRHLLRSQVAYAFPFGAAVLVEIAYSSIPQYAVSYLAGPVTFAIFAVGCLQIPLVDFAASPTSDVMMVRMKENLAQGLLSVVVEIWHDTFWKLALLFFPLVALVLVEAHDIILALFTAKYAASIPLFQVWAGLILLATLQVDGVMRVFAQIKFLLALNLMRLAIVGSLIAVSMSLFHLMGPVLVILLATVAFKIAAMLRMTRLFDIGVKDLLPWKKIVNLTAVAAGAAGMVVLFKMAVPMRPLPGMIVSSALYGIVYCVLGWRCHLLTESEEQAVAAWLRRRINRQAAGRFIEKDGVQELCAESPASSI